MRGVEEVIKEGLRKGIDTKPKLKGYCLKHGVTKSTFYRKIRKLIELGEVKEGKLELIEEAIEADRNEVEYCVEAISKALIDGDENILDSRIDQLEQLSDGKRVAHFPQVLQRIEEWLENSMLVHNSETFKKLVDTLSHILFFEQRHKPLNWDEIVERIQNRISPKAISIVRANPEFPDHHTIRFLGKCGKKEAVETIFEKIKSKPSEAHRRIDTAHALAELYSKHKNLINQQFDALIKEKKNPALVEAAKKLRQELMRHRSILLPRSGEITN